MKLSEQLSGPEGKLTRELKSRGYLLPLGRRQDDKLTFAKPEIVDDLMAAFMLPGDVYAGRVAPMSQEAIERGFDLAGAVTLGAGAVPSGANTLRAGIKAYHGSPHDFDKFDMSKIGTGEGAQAYGHGLYFAESEGVARSYREKLASADSAARNPSRAGQEILDGARGDKAAARKQLDWEFGVDTDPKAARNPVYQEALAYIENANPGRMYEVNINANPDDFLDWDAPLSAQSPKVQDAYQRFSAANPEYVDPKMAGGQYENPTGKDFLGAYSEWVPHGNNDMFNYRRKFTDDLSEAGIPGIKYLDQGSRVAGEGSRNFVVFDPEIIKIVRKYGIFAALAGGLLTQEQADDLRAQGIADL